MGALSIKDLGKIHKILSMRDEKGSTLNQQATIEELLKQHGLASRTTYVSQYEKKTTKRILIRRYFLGKQYTW